MGGVTGFPGEYVREEGKVWHVVKAASTPTYIKTQCGVEMASVFVKYKFVEMTDILPVQHRCRKKGCRERFANAEA